MRRISPVGFSILLLLTFCSAQDSTATLRSIRGEVATRNQSGEPAVLPGARIVLHGPINKEAKSDASGAFAIEGLPPGMYDIEASAPGLNSAVAVEVKPGVASIVPIELGIATVRDSVTVAANDPPRMEDSAQKNTITQSVIEAAPNQTEKIDSLLPLVPGVVRGPDGRINMKGAQATQAGWLVNSANVTDPATGGQAINLPIDVVSSVEVISNPHDPEYGKFTGAISSVETRTGNLDKFHLSAQNFVPRAKDRDGNIVRIGAFTPRLTFTGPLVKDRLAFTQSFESRFVRTPVEIGKEIPHYDALDTGMFLCSPTLFERLDMASTDGNCSLSDGMRQLIAERRLRALEIGDAQWQDLDTPEALAHAEGIFAGCFYHEHAYERVAHV